MYSRTCYSFAQYYEDLLIDRTAGFSIPQFVEEWFKDISERLKTIDFNKTKFLSYDEYLGLFGTKEARAESMSKEFFDFPNKFLKSNCAQVNRKFANFYKIY